MGVRLLAGPFDVTLTETDAADGVVVEVELKFYWPGVGLIGSGGSGGTIGRYAVPTGVMTLDGRYCDRSGTIFEYAGWWSDKNTPVMTESRAIYGHEVSTYERMFDPITFAGELTGPLGPFVDGHPLELYRYIKLPDRNIVFLPSPATPDHSFVVVVDGVQVGMEGPPPPFGVVHGNAMGGRSPTDVFVAQAGSTGGFTRAIFYDTLTQQWASSMITVGMPCYSLVYVSDWHVLVSMHNWVTDSALDGKSNQIRIWSLEVHPTILSAIEAMDSVKSGRIVTYRVRLTGDHQDACEGELIDWAVTGAGTLLTLQSATDAEGYATTQVQYGVTETGLSVVEARLQC